MVYRGRRPVPPSQSDFEVGEHVGVFKRGCALARAVLGVAQSCLERAGQRVRKATAHSETRCQFIWG